MSRGVGLGCESFFLVVELKADVVLVESAFGDFEEMVFVVGRDDAPVSFEEAFVDGDQSVLVVGVVKDEG